jgi:hypothetical protein
VSRYDWFRRRIAPVAFVVAILLMARQSCEKGGHDKATFVLDLGTAAADVRVVDAELWVGSTEVAVYHRAALAGTTMRDLRFEANLPAPDGELRLDVELVGAHRTFTRRVHAVDGATVVLELAPDLR